MIYVTRPSLPPFEEYNKYLKGIWERNILTNDGPLVKELEKKLKEYFQAEHLFFVSNGTIALQIAIKVLDLKGEIITTPFSYVATTSSIVWESCKPVFADIDPVSLTIDPKKIEAAITEKTSAILPTHIYGNPCNIEKISAIARKYNLKVIYDAAHCFGVKYKGIDLVNYGDISTLSFHATKLFHTVEGGALVTSDSELARRIAYTRNFGHKNELEFLGLGINGKNSELHAAMGLCNLPGITGSIEKRKKTSELYNQNLISKAKNLKKIPFVQDSQYNYGYYIVIFNSETELEKAYSALRAADIFPRRYFYPSLNKLNYVDKYNVPIAEDVSKRVLCLPLYDELADNDVLNICRIILSV
jgi:dTDP-4-amino-4,6-dideoxygalactose transaminase